MIRNSETGAQDIAGELGVAPHYSETRRIIRVFFRRKLSVVGLFFILLLVFTAIFGPLIAPYDPDKMELSDQLQQPSWKHLLGLIL
jgi:peptide/nickel transport system permease protein